VADFASHKRDEAVSLIALILAEDNPDANQEPLDKFSNGSIVERILAFHEEAIHASHPDSCANTV